MTDTVPNTLHTCLTACQMDLVFVVDSSGSICDNDKIGAIDDAMPWLGCYDFDEVRLSIEDMIGRSRYIGPDGMRVALVTFDNFGKLRFGLDQ